VFAENRQRTKSFLSLWNAEKIFNFGNNALFRPHELKTCLEAGCNGYIVKPFSFLDLEIEIRELLGTSSEQLALN
jgi:CheY-like chemotaxis protein